MLDSLLPQSLDRRDDVGGAFDVSVGGRVGDHQLLAVRRRNLSKLAGIDARVRDEACPRQPVPQVGVEEEHPVRVAESPVRCGLAVLVRGEAARIAARARGLGPNVAALVGHEHGLPEPPEQRQLVGDMAELPDRQQRQPEVEVEDVVPANGASQEVGPPGEPKPDRPFDPGSEVEVVPVAERTRGEDGDITDEAQLALRPRKAVGVPADVGRRVEDRDRAVSRHRRSRSAPRGALRAPDRSTRSTLLGGSAADASTCWRPSAIARGSTAETAREDPRPLRCARPRSPRRARGPACPRRGIRRASRLRRSFGDPPP